MSRQIIFTPKAAKPPATYSQAVKASCRTRETAVTPPSNVDDAMRRRAPPRTVCSANGYRARLAPGCRG